MNVDALGNPLRIILTAGQRHESTQAKALLVGFESKRVMGESAYDANAIIGDINSSGAEPIIPARSNRLEQRDYDRRKSLWDDRELYKERHLVECFIGKLKQ